MSWKASAYVLDLAHRYRWLTPTHLSVLYALGARHHQDYHCAFGSLRLVAGDTHLHEVTVSTTISDLEEKGILRVFEGQLPSRRSDPDDRRRTRGSMWCFVGLDPDDGPDVVGAVPRVRTSGRPPSPNGQDSISPGLIELEPDDLAGNEGSISPGLPDELAGDSRSISRKGGDDLAGLNSPLKPAINPAKEPVFKAGYEPVPPYAPQGESRAPGATEDGADCCPGARLFGPRPLPWQHSAQCVNHAPPPRVAANASMARIAEDA